jgi:hypothetical protein
MRLSTQLQTFIEVLAAVAAFGSAVFWYEAAKDKLNARAAVFSGISALLVWIALAGF